MRERWFHECVDLMRDGAIFMTKRAHQEFMEKTFPF
ncbi:hypothetical protein LMG19083_03899 [Ralstonia psammae]|uniref:Uncharacterized protein n=1 Tax=Ralstonia psammae TaxID=3058598 RepID=A0ABM9JT69_9RALS|nr:hypothetical protein LMG19083_03899 [Ralstonia sp. LMG 19083]